MRKAHIVPIALIITALIIGIIISIATCIANRPPRVKSKNEVRIEKTVNILKSRWDKWINKNEKDSL